VIPVLDCGYGGRSYEGIRAELERGGTGMMGNNALWSAGHGASGGVDSWRFSPAPTNN